MNTIFLLALQLILYSVIPFVITFIKNPFRKICFYTYLGTLLVFANIMGSIYSCNIDGIRISGGNIAYAVILFTLVLMVIAEQDIFIIRNAALLIIILNIFFFFLYKTIYLALNSSTTSNPIPAALFDTSLKIVIIGTGLLIFELFLLFILFEAVKRVFKNIIILSILYSFFFILIISLDGFLFQIIAFAFDKNLPNFIRNGLLGKFILGCGFCIPLYLFLVINKNRFREFSRQPFALADFFFKEKKALLSEIRKQKTALHERDQLIKAITESAQDCIFAKNRAFQYTFVNPAMCTLLKCKPEHFLGKTPAEIFDKESAASIAAVEKPVIEGKITNAVITLDILGVPRIFHTIQVPVYNQAGEIDGICGIARDVTDIKHAEKNLEKLNFRLQEKNSELEQIIYATSHDLRSPLVNIKGFSEELQFSVQAITELLKPVALPESTAGQIQKIVYQDISRWVEYIIGSITRMSNFLSNLLKISRLGRQSVLLTEVDMNAIIKNLLKSFEFQVSQAGILLETGELPPCITDSERISQVFANLIDNAIKYLKPGENGHIRITGEPKGDYNVYCVEDNGIGIEEKYLAKIFEIFYRMNARDIPGEGIGLTIVKKILNMIDGEISVASVPGTGSKFCIKLPAVSKNNG